MRLLAAVGWKVDGHRVETWRLTEIPWESGCTPYGYTHVPCSRLVVLWQFGGIVDWWGAQWRRGIDVSVLKMAVAMLR